jgi:hypothetical protein
VAVVKVSKTVVDLARKAVVHQVTFKAVVVQVAFKETSSQAAFKAAKENFKI